MFHAIVTKGNQGVHTYFTATMRWGELDHVLVFPEQLGDLDEDKQMQRGLAKARIGDLVEYLDAPDHFFSAVTLVILPRDLSEPAREGAIRDDADYQFDPRDLDGPVSTQEVGDLYLSGEVRLFPADGQHRCRSAIDRMKTDKSISKEEVPVVLVPYKDYDQVRQLFADLNLNAKPVSRTIGLDYESRNPVVLVVKEAAELVPLFNGRINRANNSLPTSSSAVITLSTLTDGSEDILTALAKRACINDGGAIDTWDKKSKRAIRRAFATKDKAEAASELAEVWAFITNLFPEQRDVLTGLRTAGDNRDDYLFAHGLGQRGLALAAANLIEEFPDGDEWKDRLNSAVSSFDWGRKADEWKGTAVIHDVDADGKPTYRINNTGTAVQRLADKITDKARKAN
jgi:DGQHR domain-containing protein